MNKEEKKDLIEEMIEQLKEYASGGVSGLYPFEESVKALLDYINQLETNRDEAIKELKNFKNNAWSLTFYTKVEEFIEILERGKE